MRILVYSCLGVLVCLILASLGSFGVAVAESPSLVVSRRFDTVVFFVDNTPVTKVYGSYQESFNVTFTLHGGQSSVDVDRASFISLVNRQAFGTRYRWSEAPYVRLIEPASIEGVRDTELLQPWNLSYRGKEQELRLANYLIYARSPTMMVQGASPIYYTRFQTRFELQFADGETVLTDLMTVYEVELRVDEPSSYGSVQFVKVGDHPSPVDEQLSLAEAGISNLSIEVAGMAQVLTSLQQRFEHVEAENRRLSNEVANLTSSQLPLQHMLVDASSRLAEIESQNYHLQWQLDRAESKKEDLQASVDRLTAISVAFFASTATLLCTLLLLRRRR